MIESLDRAPPPHLQSRCRRVVCVLVLALVAAVYQLLHVDYDDVSMGVDDSLAPGPPSLARPLDHTAFDAAIHSILLPPFGDANPYVVKHVTEARRAFWSARRSKLDRQKEDLLVRFGSTNGTRYCWTQEKDLHYKKWVYVGDCPADGTHKMDNRTNCMIARKKLCEQLNAEMERLHPLPSELAPSLVVPEVADVVPKQLPHADVRDLLDKLMAALYIFYDGVPDAHDSVEPRAGNNASSAVHADMVRGVALRLAVAILKKRAKADPRERKLVLGVVGDSTAQGMDNCYYDSWPATVERVFAPVAAAFGLGVEARNAGHNGWVQLLFQRPELQHGCIGSILGMEDVDIVVSHFPYIKVDEKSLVDAYSDLFARCIMQGAVAAVSFHAPYGAFVPFYRAGVFLGPVMDRMLEMQQWWPTRPRNVWPFRGEWRLLGDGFCHLNGTRSGSRSIFDRTWHPGPLRHQMRVDMLVSFLAKALRVSVDMLDLAERMGDVDRLHVLGERLVVTEVAEGGKEVHVPPFALCGVHSHALYGKRAYLRQWLDLEASKGDWKLTRVSAGELSGFVETFVCNRSTEVIDDTLWTPFDTDCSSVPKAKGRGYRAYCEAFYPLEAMPGDRRANCDDFDDYTPKYEAWKLNRTIVLPYGDNIFGFDRPRPYKQCRHPDGGELVTGVGHLRFSLPVDEARELSARTRIGRIDHFRVSVCGRVYNETNMKFSVNFFAEMDAVQFYLGAGATAPAKVLDDRAFGENCVTMVQTMAVADGGELIDPVLELHAAVNITLYFVRLEPVMR